MKFFQGVVQQFEAAHPNIAVHMEAVADEPYKAKIRIVMASGDIPDVFFSWSGEYARQFIRAGRALDLTSALSAPEWSGRYVPSTLEPFKLDGKIWGVPQEVDAKFMVYSKALFQKAGVGAPSNWDEFTAALDKIKTAGITPISFGSQLPWATSHYVGDLNAKLVPSEVRMADYQLKASEDRLFTDPGYVDSLTRFEDFLKKGWFNKTPNAIPHAIARASFLAGRDAMMYLELVEFARVKETKLEQDGWGFFPMPPIPNGRGEQNMLTGAPDGFLVSSASKHPNEALLFLSFLTNKANGAQFTKITGRPSAVIGAVTSDNASPEVLGGMDAIAKAPALALWLDTDVESRVASAYLAGAQALMGETETPQQVMEKVRQAALQARKQPA
jgi:raffinose/stachyose/melibiose transport system substrate-binding protein